VTFRNFGKNIWDVVDYVKGTSTTIHFSSQLSTKMWLQNTQCFLLLSVKDLPSLEALILHHYSQPYHSHTHACLVTLIFSLCFIITFLMANRHSHSLVSDTITPLMFYFLSVCSSSSLIHSFLSKAFESVRRWLPCYKTTSKPKIIWSG